MINGSRPPNNFQELLVGVFIGFCLGVFLYGSILMHFRDRPCTCHKEAQ